MTAGTGQSAQLQGHGVDGQGISIKFPTGADTSLFFTAPRKRSRTHPVYYPTGTAGPLNRGKATSR